MGKAKLSGDDVQRMEAEKNLEGLIEALNYEEDFRIQLKAAEAMARIKDEKFIEPLIRALKDENSHVRGEVAWALGELGSTVAVESLLPMLKDESGYVRGSVAEALGKIGDGRASESLIQALSDKEGYVQMRAEAALNKMGKQVVATLIQTILKSNDNYVRSQIAKILVNIGEPAVEPLIKLLKNEDKDTQGIAALALGEIGDARAVEPLLQMMKNVDFKLHMNLGLALLKIKDEKALPSLIQALKSENADVRRSAGVFILHNFRALAVEPLIQLLSDDKEQVRAEAARLLGEAGDKRAIEPLIKILNDESENVRSIAIESLRKIGDERTWEHLSRALKEQTGVDASKRLDLIEKIIHNCAQYHAYDTGDFAEDFQSFNPAEYARLKKELGDSFEEDFWNYSSPEDLFEDAMEELFYYMKNAEKSVRLKAFKVFTEAQSKVSYIESRYSDEWLVHNELNKEIYWNFFINAIGEEDTEIRNAAKSAIMGFPKFLKYPSLCSLIESENPQQRESVRQILADEEIEFLRSEEGFPFREFLKHLLKAAGQKDDDVRALIASKIENLEEQSYSEIFVEELRTSPNEWIREFSAKMLRHQIYWDEEEIEAAEEALTMAIKDTSPRVRRIAAETMGALYEYYTPGKSPFVEPLIKALADEDQGTREAAFKSLGILGVEKSSLEALAEAIKTSTKTEADKDTKPLELFLKMLEDEEPLNRRLAAFSLGQLGDPKAVENLKSALKDKNCEVREAAALALGSFPRDDVFEALTNALSDDVSHVRRAVISVLPKTGGEKAVEPLIKALDDRETDVRMDAATALGEIKNEAAARGLLKALKDSSGGVSNIAYNYLVRSHGIYVMDELTKMLKEPSSTVKRETADILTQIGDGRALKPLFQLIADKDRWTADTATRALVTLGEKYPEEFRRTARSLDDSFFEALTSHSERTPIIIGSAPNEAILQLCLLIGDTRVLPAVLHQYAAGSEHTMYSGTDIRRLSEEAINYYFKDVSVETLLDLLQKIHTTCHRREVLIEAKIISMLGEKGDPRIIKPVFEKLADSEQVIRNAANQALMKFGKQFADLLVPALESPNPCLRENAIEMLGKMGDKRVTQAALEALKDEKQTQTRDKAIEALGLLQEEKAIEPLLKELKKGNAKAAEALRRIGRQKILKNAPKNIDGIPLTTYIQNLAKNPYTTETQGDTKITHHFSDQFKEEINKLLHEIEK